MTITHQEDGDHLGAPVLMPSATPQAEEDMQAISSDSEVIPFVPADTLAAVPKSNYDAVRFNAVRHGILSRYAVLAHESGDEYESLLSALMTEHQPAGATEAHLVEELAGAIWRKRRVLQAEGASINQGLKGSVRDSERVIPAAAPFEAGLSGKGTDIRDLVGMTPDEVATQQRDARADLDATCKAAAILRRGGSGAYERALRSLRADSRNWWRDFVADEEYTETADGLAEFISTHLEPVCRQTEKEARHHDAIKAQALGEGLQAQRMEKLNRYETHLDRKFERTLAMLLKLKELRRGA